MKRNTESTVENEFWQKGREIQMIRIIICDDDPVFLNEMYSSVVHLLNATRQSVKIHTYSSWKEIGDPILSSCDIALLDIDFAKTEYTGIDIAKKIRKARPDAVIIFITNYIDYAPEGYEVDAFRYILKSQINKKLPKYLSQAILHLQKTGKTMKIQINGEIIDIRLKDILYMESDQHTVLVHFYINVPRQQIKTYRFYDSLSNLEKRFESHGFLRIHKSFLVNIDYIQRYHCRGAILTNGTELRVSEKNYSNQKEKYLLWKGK